MTPLWLKIVLLGIVGVVTIGWWVAANFALMMSPTGTAPLPLPHKVVGWALLAVVGALMWWVLQ